MTKRAAQTHEWFVALDNGQTMEATASSLELATKAMNSYRSRIARDAKRFPKYSCEVLNFGVSEK